MTSDIICFATNAFVVKINYPAAKAVASVNPCFPKGEKFINAIQLHPKIRVAIPSINGGKWVPIVLSAIDHHPLQWRQTDEVTTQRYITLKQRSFVSFPSYGGLKAVAWTQTLLNVITIAPNVSEATALFKSVPKIMSHETHVPLQSMQLENTMASWTAWSKLLGLLSCWGEIAREEFECVAGIGMVFGSSTDKWKPTGFTFPTHFHLRNFEFEQQENAFSYFHGDPALVGWRDLEEKKKHHGYRRGWSWDRDWGERARNCLQIACGSSTVQTQTTQKPASG
jgi:hypothetical protein